MYNLIKIYKKTIFSKIKYSMYLSSARVIKTGPTCGTIHTWPGNMGTFDFSTLRSNNLPNNIEVVYIVFYDEIYQKIENLPISIKKIVIEDEKYKQYITKIPFDCEVEFKNFDID